MSNESTNEHCHDNLTTGLVYTKNYTCTIYVIHLQIPSCKISPLT